MAVFSNERSLLDKSLIMIAHHVKKQCECIDKYHPAYAYNRTCTRIHKLWSSFPAKPENNCFAALGWAYLMYNLFSFQLSQMTKKLDSVYPIKIVALWFNNIECVYSIVCFETVYIRLQMYI